MSRTRIGQRRRAFLLATSLCFAMAAAAAPETERESTDAAKGASSVPEAATEESATPVYRPPRRGAPKTRVGGGTRDAAGDATPAIALLAPPSTGFTTRASPVLYWYLSSPFEGRFEFVVAERSRQVVAPLFRRAVDGRYDAGYHALDLGAYDVQLVENRVYQWSVAIVRDPERRSQDIVAVATVERIGAEDLGAAPSTSVNHLADAGLWYDAIEAIGPPAASATGRDQLDALLRQVGLAEVRSDG